MNSKMALVFSTFAIGVVSLTHLFGWLLTDQTIVALDTLACNVPADYATIQLAVNEPTCNEVFLDSGTFIETVSIDRSITIQGQGQQNTLVKPDSSNSVFAIDSGVAVTLTNMTIANGNDFTPFGGGIYVDNSALTIEYITLADNRAQYRGAGIYNLGGEILIDNSQLIGNLAGEGAGIYNLGGDIAIENSLLKGNSGVTVTGGAIYTQGGGTVTIRHSILEENSASGSSQFGGAIYNDGSTVQIEFCDLLANTSDQQGGAIYNKNGMIDLSSSQIRDNDAGLGGAIANLGFMNITESDLIDNEASGHGAAILNVGTMLVEGGNIRTNYADTSGGGIANWGDLTVADSTFIANNSTYEGGAIHNEKWIASSVAKVKITNSQFRQNSSASGGAIMNAGGAMIEIVDATLLDNSAQFGGAILNWENSAYGMGILNVTNSALAANSADYGGALTNAGEATIENSTFSGNQGYEGGGIRNYRGRLVISGSTLAENSSSMPGGGIFNNDGTVTVTDSTLSGNSAVEAGGGIGNNYGTVTVTNSTLSGNVANGGGGIGNNDGTVTVTNSTLSDNSATFDGGGIYNFGGTLTMTNSTLSGNSAGDEGGGIRNNSGGTLTVTNSLLVKGSSGANCSDLSMDASNIADDGSCGSATQKLTAEINLGPLADNGGPTLTHALLPGSAAIDFNASASCAAAPVDGLDQRGQPRNVDIPGEGNDGGSDLCDTGAFEVQLPATSTIYLPVMVGD